MVTFAAAYHCPFGQCQHIVLDDRATRVWTTCLGLLTGSQTHDLWITSLTVLHHSTTLKIYYNGRNSELSSVCRTIRKCSIWHCMHFTTQKTRLWEQKAASSLRVLFIFRFTLTELAVWDISTVHYISSFVCCER